MVDHRLGETKGLISPVTLDGSALTEWTGTLVDVERIAAGLGAAASGSIAGRTALRGAFTLDAPADLYLDTASWGKGFAFVNGFFLGRYWANGPQRTLYVPAPATRAGENEIVVLELEQVAKAVAAFVSDPDLGHREE